jgi:hypothetical protein
MSNESKNTAIYTAFDDLEQPEIITPERNLLRAVLLNAVADLRRPGDFHRKATEYFLSREEDYVFSFHSVCGYLNIDPRQILVLVGLENGRPEERRTRDSAGEGGGVEELIPLHQDADGRGRPTSG